MAGPRAEALEEDAGPGCGHLCLHQASSSAHPSHTPMRHTPPSRPGQPAIAGATWPPGGSPPAGHGGACVSHHCPPPQAAPGRTVTSTATSAGTRRCFGDAVPRPCSPPAPPPTHGPASSWIRAPCVVGGGEAAAAGGKRQRVCLTPSCVACSECAVASTQCVTRQGACRGSWRHGRCRWSAVVAPLAAEAVDR